MNRLHFWLLAAIMFIGAASARVAFAQDGGPERHGPMGMDGKMAEHMKDKLGLSDEQFGKLKAAMKEHGDSLKPLGDKMKADVKTLSEQVEKKADDAALKATLADLRASRKAMAEANDRFHDSLASFLTPTQQAKLVLGMAERMRGAMGRRGPDARNQGAHGGRNAGSAPKGPPPSNEDDGE